MTESTARIREDRALIALAYLESRLMESPNGSDRVGLFQPLINDTLQRHFAGTRFGEKDVAYWVEKDHGLELPMPVIAVLLKRCVRNSTLRPDDGMYTFGTKPFEFSNFTDEEIAIKKSQASLIGALREYAQRKGVSIDDDTQLREILYGYLRNCFSARSQQLPGDSTGNVQAQYRWIHAFFEDATKNDATYLETAIAILKGLVVYDTAFYPDFCSSTPSLKGITVYLDSPIICAALDMSGDHMARYSVEAIEMLRNAGVHLRVFDITINEIRRILNGILQKWQRGDYSASPRSYGEWLRKKGQNIEDLWELDRSLEREIQKRTNARIVSIPDRNPLFVQDEEQLEQRLSDEDDISMSTRVKHDVDCTVAISTLRRNISPRTLKEARDIFASTSWLTIRNIHRWWKEDEERFDIPPVMDLCDLANIAWLATPVKYEGFQKEALIATCATALLPSDTSWEKCIERLTHLVKRKKISPDEAQLMIADNDLTIALSRYDYSKDEREYTNTDYDAVIEEAKANVTKEIANQMEATYQCQVEKYVDLSEKEAQKNAEYRNRVEAKARANARRLASAILVVCAIVVGIFVGIIANLIIGAARADNSYNNAFVFSLLGSVIPSILGIILTLYFGFHGSGGLRAHLSERLMPLFMPE